MDPSPSAKPPAQASSRSGLRLYIAAVMIALAVVASEPTHDVPGKDGRSVSVPVAGYGAGTTGGAGGRVYRVSTWAQFKAAALAAGRRTIALTGSANIDGRGERIVIDHGNLTVDGSAWTGSLKRYSIVLRASNVILTNVRFRPGDQLADVGEGDGLTIDPGVGSELTDVVIDHCSLLWAPDVVLAILNSSSNITVQYSIIGGGLYHSANPTAIPPDRNGYGLNITTPGNNRSPETEYAQRITFYRNYILHNNQRNMRAHGADRIEFVNNVFYNWGADLGHGNPRRMSIVGNMFKKGPNTPASTRVWRNETNDTYGSLFSRSIYWADNLGIGFTPTMDFGPGVQRSSPWGGSGRGARTEVASGELADIVVSQAGPTSADVIDQGLKADWVNGTGRFYNGIGLDPPNPHWP